MNILKSGILLFLSLFSVLTFAQQTPLISQQALLKLMANESENVLVLDVRSAEEFAQGHIEGAVNISHTTINENLAKIIDFKNKTVIVHCRSGRRAVAAESALLTAGFSDLRHLEGDMKGWKAANLPVVK